MNFGENNLQLHVVYLIFYQRLNVERQTTKKILFSYSEPSQEEKCLRSHVRKRMINVVSNQNTLCPHKIWLLEITFRVPH